MRRSVGLVARTTKRHAANVPRTPRPASEKPPGPQVTDARAPPKKSVNVRPAAREGPPKPGAGNPSQPPPPPSSGKGGMSFARKAALVTMLGVTGYGTVVTLGMRDEMLRPTIEEYVPGAKEVYQLMSSETTQTKPSPEILGPLGNTKSTPPPSSSRDVKERLRASREEKKAQRQEEQQAAQDTKQQDAAVIEDAAEDITPEPATTVQPENETAPTDAEVEAVVVQHVQDNIDQVTASGEDTESNTADGLADEVEPGLESVERDEPETHAHRQLEPTATTTQQQQQHNSGDEGSESATAVEADGAGAEQEQQQQQQEAPASADGGATPTQEENDETATTQEDTATTTTAATAPTSAGEADVIPPPPPELPDTATMEEKLQHAIARAQYLEAQLERQTQGEIDRVSKLLDHQAAVTSSSVREAVMKERSSQQAMLAAEVRRLRTQFEEEVERTRAEAEEKAKTELHEHLRVQENKHEQSLRDALNEQAKRIWEESEASMRVKLGQERAHRIAKLEGMFLRLKAVEAVMSEYAARDRTVRHMHALILASDVLADALEQRRPLRDAVAHVRKAVAGDELVSTVVESLNTKQRVVTPSDLIGSFETHRDRAREVAHVPAYGGMLAHALSYITSRLTFKPLGL
ncbi:hypothetical protein PTSG_11492, partial [Salpingoeca rosetta]